MYYKCTLESGQSLQIGLEGARTALRVTSSGQSRAQVQGAAFITGEWTHPPAVYQQQGMAVVQIVTNEGPRYIAWDKSGLTQLTSEPDMRGAPVELQPA